MGGTALDLARLVESELSRPAPAAAERIAAEIRRRHGESVSAVLFYGSCLRRGSSEGVLDFYALVDGYREAYTSRRLALANALLPPNVFYLELDGPQAPVRAKYAVFSLADFETAAGPNALRPGVWARFCQPALAVWTRDDRARQRVVAAAVRSIVTAVSRLVPLLPLEEGGQRFLSREFWPLALRETYAAEMRPEAPDTVRGLFLNDPERYARAADLALAVLSERGELSVRRDGDAVWIGMEPRERRRRSLGWRMRQPLRKAVYLAGLAKTAFTFGDWLPYALWKLERHSGTRLVPSPRQRRHPLIWGWPLLFRALWRRDLR